MKTIAITLLLLAYAVLQSYAQVSSHWPEDVNGKWSGYAGYVTLVILAPSLILLLLFMSLFAVWCCRKVFQSCGGSKANEEGYSERNIKGYQVAHSIIYGIVIVLILACMVLTIITGSTLKKVSKSTVHTMNHTTSSYNLFTSTIDQIDGIAGTIVDHALNQFDGAFNDIDESFVSMSESVSVGLGEATSMYATVDHIDTLLTRIRAKLQDSQKYEGAPDPNSIPSISSTKDQISSAVTFLNQAGSTLNNSRAEIGSAKNMLSVNQQQIRDTLNGYVGGFKKNLSGTTSAVTYLVKRFNTMSRGFSLAWKVGYGFYVLIYYMVFIGVGALLTASLVGICMRSKVVAKISVGTTYLSAVAFAVLATVLLALFIGVNDVCREVEPAVENWVTSSFSEKSTFKMNGTLVKEKILFCTAEDSMLETVPDFRLTDLQSQIGKYTNEMKGALDSEFSRFNPASIATTMSFLNEFKIDALMLSMINVQSQISSAEVSVTTFKSDAKKRFDNEYAPFDLEANTKLNEINQRSEELGGDQFTMDNIDTLDPFSSPYRSDIQYFIERQQWILMYKSKKESDTEDFNKQMQQMDEILTDLLEISGELQIVDTNLNALNAEIVNMNSTVNSLPALVNVIRSLGDGTVEYTEQQMNILISNIEEATRCEYVGSYYRSTRKQLCYRMSPLTGVFTALMYIIALLLMGSFLLMLPTTKRMGPPKKVVTIDIFNAPQVVAISTA